MRLALVCLALCLALPALAQDVDPALKAAVDNPARDAKNRARDPFRHPLEALGFFGVKPDSVVVEIDPGGAGYWTEILAPYLKAKGRYVAANPEPTNDEAKRFAAAFAAKLASDPDAFGRVETTEFAGEKAIVAPGSAGFVLTCRNLQNWM